MTMDLLAVLHRTHPDSSWILDGSEYSGLVWMDDDMPKPTEAECLDAWVTIEQEIITQEVKTSRQAAYAMQSDPMYFRWQRGEATEQDWLDSVEAVRQQYPYPI